MVLNALQRRCVNGEANVVQAKVVQAKVVQAKVVQAKVGCNILM